MFTTISRNPLRVDRHSTTILCRITPEYTEIRVCLPHVMDKIQQLRSFEKRFACLLDNIIHVGIWDLEFDGLQKNKKEEKNTQKNNNIPSSRI